MSGICKDLLSRGNLDLSSWNWLQASAGPAPIRYTALVQPRMETTSYGAAASLTGVSKYKIHRLDYDFAESDTPYGPLVKDIEIELEPEPHAPAAAPPKYYKLRYVCPFALLFLVCASNGRFFDLLVKSLQTFPETREPAGRLSIYFDDVTPGNCRRLFF